ncbi:unnamed protein product [Rotaria socialis]|uniref:C-type lectin domain-containing protein n=1 Tax=Rotaria socialis TaxID=392032 RepID=A0A821GB36_9BILA|nr:unnamed protein product [Rotaria socialis]CAF4390559.1 unnamed protein product [Rotaria socialis]CAF4662937.1 unnamed protein product [Rotaria socialis]
MNMTIFIETIILPLLIFQFSIIKEILKLASNYGGFCYSDSDCDQHQKCSSTVCQCNLDERRFWTGRMCAICATGYTVTNDRCYKLFNELKTWEASRVHCRAQYADLFSWRDNHDEKFIRPAVQNWVVTPAFLNLWPFLSYQKPNQPYIAWSGAIITSVNPHKIQWADPAGITLDSYSKEWCDPTKDAGYLLRKEPTSESANGTEHEQCIAYNFGAKGTSFLCLSDDYCNQKYPFICEMNTASMALATATHHGSNAILSPGDDGNPLSETENGIIDFEEPPTPPPENLEFNGQDIDSVAGALKENTGFQSKTNIMIFAGVGAVLLVGAIAGFVVLKNKRSSANNTTGRHTSASQSRPSFASSIGSMVDE